MAAHAELWMRSVDVAIDELSERVRR
jgi:hypothetical protein